MIVCFRRKCFIVLIHKKKPTIRKKTAKNQQFQNESTQEYTNSIIDEACHNK